MGCDIHGYIEHDFFGEYKKGKMKAWYPAMDIRMIVERNYKIFSRLFGVRSSGEEAVAYNRGLPPDEKKQNKPKNPDDYWDERPATVKDLELWKNDAHSVTYIYWKEIKDVLINDYESLVYEGWEKIPWGWKFVFDTMEKLAEHKGDKGVRMVVWFDN